MTTSPFAPKSAAEPQPALAVPPRPRSVEETGLSLSYISDMIVRALYIVGEMTGQMLVDMLRLPYEQVIDQAIDDVTNLRGTLGAFQQNTLEATANNLRATLENTVAAESTIRDTDYAQEIANFTKQQILLQTGISVLANANQVPQLVLSLLQR